MGKDQVRVARLAGNRYVSVGVTALALFLSCVALAFAYTHTTNGVLHGLGNEIFGRDYYPVGSTNPPGNPWSSAAVRHYFDDGSYNTQCEQYGWGGVYCIGDWGSAPCHKRYVGGAEGVLARHWVRRDASCPGQIHG